MRTRTARTRTGAGRQQELARNPSRFPELDVRHCALVEAPAHVRRSYERLSAAERARFQKAWGLLAAGADAVALGWHGVTLAGPGVYEALLARSWSLRHRDPEEMVHLAKVAIEVAGDLDPRRYGRRRVADLQARSWGELANGYRAADRLRSAERAFGKAWALLLRGTGDRHLTAHLLDLEASLLGACREFKVGLKQLEVLPGLYYSLGEVHRAGRALTIRAIYTYYSGKAEEAVRINEQGMALLDKQGDPGLLMMAVHNQLIFLVDLGSYSHAKRVLFENRRHFIYDDRISALKLRWTEGRIYYGLREMVSAETALREARDGFLKEGLQFAAALCSLDLALVLMRQEWVAEAETEVLAAQEIFLAFDIEREYIGSVVLLCEAFRIGEATVDLLETTVAFIRRKEIEGPKRLR